VSKINQWVSLFTLFIWLVLIIHALPEINTKYCLSLRHLVVGGFTILFGILIFVKGKTDEGSYDHLAEKRETKIVE